MILRIWFACLLAIISAGCAVRLTPEQIASADYGPKPENYQDIVKSLLTKSLFDPESARYEFQELRKGYMQGDPPKFGWAVCGTVNAKNRFGGYVGRQAYFVLIYHGTIVGYTPPHRYNYAIKTCEKNRLP